MVLTKQKKLLGEAISILYHKGLVELFQASLRFLNLNYKGYYAYFNYLYRDRVCKSCKTTDPFKIVRVDPSNITHVPKYRLHRWRHLGAVISGDWDQSGKLVEERIKYKSLIQHFENNVPWEETTIHREAIKHVKQNEPYWNGCVSSDDITERTESIDQLYENIRREGFKSQEEIHGKPYQEIICNRNFDHSMVEIAVAIGRNGEIIFIDGHHRLAISHILEIDEISVHVVARHEQWERIRDKLQSSKHHNELDREVQDYIDHPDIQCVV